MFPKRGKDFENQTHKPNDYSCQNFKLNCSETDFNVTGVIWETRYGQVQDNAH